MILADTPALVRLKGRKDYWLGRLWQMLGSEARATARFELAAKRRPGWARPLIVIAILQARHDQHVLAMATFRRALEANRHEVEHSARAIGALATSFLRRAEEVEREGRREIARGLLEEVTALDLRRAPSPLRFEVSRRYEAARRGNS